MVVSDSQDSLILPNRPNGGNHESTPDLVRLDTENLSDIIVSISRVVGLTSSMEKFLFRLPTHRFISI